ncbi:leukotriene A-4 hydrolase-like [Artemia franciscana]|uniref:Leukotriene A(4) hydrolase n=2 Tax=Artemia franciscana TaxID=6661 RepID=A0AA88HP67_ARTSF|nr:hypothetical protein QYM36_014115 [Artemia franciscana]
MYHVLPIRNFSIYLGAIVVLSSIVAWSALSQGVLTLCFLKENSMAGPIPRLSPGDPNSYSRPDLVKVTKIDLDLDVDFDRHILFGTASLDIQRINSTADSLVLDAKDLTIKQVKDEVGSILAHTLDVPLGSFGSKLTIALKITSATVVIEYETSPNATGLQWLNPQQTSGKTHPFLFSQCEAIHCRSVLPCQDTPAVKAPYTATVRVPKEIVVLMSAQRKNVSETEGVYKFEQSVPIPAYLIAIVAGKLDSRVIGDRSRVWAEPDVVEKAAYEFAETDDFLKAAESLAGPYVWGNYDILVLPPSFPFGGMENPCLTFATPTLLAGDRSLTFVIAHEIAHSWTGNLVTNANFEHFWLNEGFTVFLERKINGRLYGEQSRQFAAIGGWNDLEEVVNTLGADNEFTKLNPDLTGSDPDDAFSSIPYEKGSVFLWYLSDIVGNEDFEEWLKTYIKHFQYQSIQTEDFKTHLLNYFKDHRMADKLDQVEWDTWLHGKGLPPYKPSYDYTLAEACTALKNRWVDWIKDGMPQPAPFSPLDIRKFSSMQVVEFLVQIFAENIPEEAIKQMEKAYALNDNHNSEIRLRWMRLCIQGRWKEQVSPALDYATSQGRMKFVRPIFRDLYGWEEMRQKAIDAYYAHKDQWMYMTAYAVAKDLHLEEKKD